jgi:ABC-type uncharacterized transport system involved in gliding motility auxiliary subunit
MKKTIASRVLGVLGLVLLVSTVVTVLFGNTQLVAAKAGLGLAAIAAGFALGESGGVKRFFTGRAAHFGFFTVVSALLVAGVLAMGNWVAYKKPKSWDLTKNKIFTLSEDTLKTLAALKSDVRALAFYGQADPAYGEAQDLLRRYADRSPHFKYQLVDPYKSPELVRKYAITEGGPRLVLLTGPGLETDAGKAKEPTEQALTNALVKATRSGSRRIYFTEGHGEPAPRDESPRGPSTAAKSLESEGFQVEPLSLLEKGEVPADAAAVLVVSPRKAFLDPEVQALKRYAAKGGHLGLFLEPEVNAGLDGFLKDWGIEVDEDMVVDPSPVSRLFGGSPVTPIVKPSAGHEITRELAQTGVALPTVRSLSALAGAPLTPRPLALTGPSAWGETDIKSLYGSGAQRNEGEKGGPLPVAMSAQKSTAAEKDKVSDEARLVVVGDGEFFSNQYQQLLGNLDFFLNTASWLAQQEDRITIRPKSRDATRLFLTESQASALKFLTIDVLPVALLGLGLAVWLVRRSK